jgi:hypothetical protein
MPRPNVTQTAAVLVLILWGCTALPAPTVFPIAPVESERPTGSPAPTVDLTWDPGLTAAHVDVVAEEEVVYTGDLAPLTLTSATDDGLAVGIAEVTLTFGDGTTSTVKGACDAGASPITAVHLFQSAGHFQVGISAARLCQEFATSLDGPVGILVEPSAPASTREWPRCTTFQLRMVGVNRGSALSNGGAIVTVHNVSSTGCQLDGYPGLVLFSANGARLPTDLHHATTGAYLFPAIPTKPVALRPGSYGSFQIAYGATAFGPQANDPPDFGCPVAAWVRVILPGSTEFGTARMEFAPCNGWLGVSPVFPGRDWITFP